MMSHLKADETGLSDLISAGYSRLEATEQKNKQKNEQKNLADDLALKVDNSSLIRETSPTAAVEPPAEDRTRVSVSSGATGQVGSQSSVLTTPPAAAAPKDRPTTAPSTGDNAAASGKLWVDRQGATHTFRIIYCDRERDTSYVEGDVEAARREATLGSRHTYLPVAEMPPKYREYWMAPWLWPEWKKPATAA
jgi:hypothetical protein